MFVNDTERLRATEKGEIRDSPKTPIVSELLTVTLVEHSDETTTPKRFSDVLNGINDLYFVFSELLGNRDTEELIVLGCDSCSDKTIDFKGAADVLNEIRKYFREVFHNYSTVRELQASEQIDVLEK